MDKAKKIVLQILDIIGYLDNKSIFSERFVNLCVSRALAELIEDLPLNEKTQLLSKMKLKNDLKDRATYAKNYFSQQQIDLKFTQVTRKLITEYFQYIKKDLSNIQIQKIENYLKSEL